MPDCPRMASPRAGRILTTLVGQLHAPLQMAAPIMPRAAAHASGSIESMAAIRLGARRRQSGSRQAGHPPSGPASTKDALTSSHLTPPPPTSGAGSPPPAPWCSSSPTTKATAAAAAAAALCTAAASAVPQPARPCWATTCASDAGSSPFNRHSHAATPTCLRASMRCALNLHAGTCFAANWFFGSGCGRGRLAYMTPHQVVVALAPGISDI